MTRTLLKMLLRWRPLSQCLMRVCRTIVGRYFRNPTAICCWPTYHNKARDMGRIRRSLVEKLVRAADSSFFELPQGWHVFSRYRTAELFLKHPAPPAVKYGDCVTHRELAKEYPAVKLQPARINSTQPSLASRFVTQQQHTLKQYKIKHQQQLRKQEIAEQLGKLQHHPAPAAQQQLEQQLQQELQQLDQGKQPPDLPLGKQVMDEIGHQAFEDTATSLKNELETAGRESTSGGYLEFIQEQETEALTTAVRKLQEQQAAMS